MNAPDGKKKAPIDPAEVTAAKPADDSRARLIEAAGKLIAARGYDGVSTRDIASEAGVNISLISYYFNGKEGLYKAVLLDFVASAQTLLDRVMNEFAKPEITKEIYCNHMKHVIEGMVKMKDRVPYFTNLMMREMIGGLPHARDVMETTLLTTGMRVISVMERAQKAGIIRPDIHVATHFMTMVHATDTYYMASQCNTKFSEMCLRLPDQQQIYADQIYKVFVEGVLNDNAS